MPAARNRDDNLTDDALESEIELVSELVLAATSSDGPMDQAEVDLLLGVGRTEDDVKEDGQAPESES